MEAEVTPIVDAREASMNLTELLDRAHAGEEIILARGGRPYALLGPVPPAEIRRRPGRLAGQFVGPEILDPLPEEEAAAWEGG